MYKVLVLNDSCGSVVVRKNDHDYYRGNKAPNESIQHFLSSQLGMRPRDVVWSLSCGEIDIYEVKL